MKINSLGINVTRNNQKIKILRGVSGCGKSTYAKSIVGNGIIHSTDDVISSMGDYNEFFEDIRTTNDAKKLFEAHRTNFINFKKSIEQGIELIILDNTSIKPYDIKPYAILALEMGFDDDNIEIINLGTNGLTLKELFERNRHNVPIDRINAMIQSYKHFGDIRLKDVLNSKDKIKGMGGRVLYSCVLLNEKSRSLLLNKVGHLIPNDWKVIAHHMTIKLGELKGMCEKGEIMVLKAFKIGFSDMAIAIMVDGCKSNNDIPHITIAINEKDGAKPRMSNDITEWRDIEEFDLVGEVTEITN